MFCPPIQFGGGGAPSWALRSDVAFDLDFVNGRYYGVDPSKIISLRGLGGKTADYAFDANSLLIPFGANAPRITSRGMLCELQRTNNYARSRDLTQTAVWTIGATLTIAKDQVGLTGVAGSASSITAGAVAATNTVLQTVPSLGANSTRYQTAYVKRLVGTGLVEMTQDGTFAGAAGAQDITSQLVLNQWVRCTIATQSLGNTGSLIIGGFKLSTNGDKIAVDFVQNEASLFPSSPIETGAASQVRGTDQLSFLLPTNFNTALTMFAQGYTDADATTSSTIFEFDDGTNSQRYLISRTVTNLALGTVLDGNVAQYSQNVGGGWGAVSKKAMLAATTNDFQICWDGTLGAADLTGTMPIVTTGRFHTATLAAQWSGYIERVAAWTKRLPNADLQRLTN